MTVTRAYIPFPSHWLHAKVVNFQLHESESVSDILVCSPLPGVHSHHIAELYKIEKQQQPQRVDGHVVYATAQLQHVLVPKTMDGPGFF